MLFFATTVNYLDRQVLSLTWKDFISPEFGWTDNDYGTITAVFSIIYALCNLFAGKFIDKLGTKKGYLWAIFIWSLGATNLLEGSPILPKTSRGSIVKAPIPKPAFLMKSLLDCAIIIVTSRN